jgi:hypothetical protein
MYRLKYRPRRNLKKKLSYYYIRRNINNNINYKNKMDPVLIYKKKYKFM